MENKLIHKHTSHTCNMPNSHPNALAMHKDSKSISKTKPKVRIIHIFAPKIIKTDVENFRELVQMKTGKPSSGGKKRCNEINNQDSISRRSNNNSHGLIISGMSHGDGDGDDDDDDKYKSSMNRKMLDQCSSRQISPVVVKEELPSDEISCGGYLGGFSDLEGFISDQLGGFQLLPLDNNHLQGFE